MKDYDAIQQKVEDLRKKVAERDKAFQKLEMSLAVQKLWEDAFAHGECTVQLKGNFGDLRSLKIELKNKYKAKTFSIFSVPEIIARRHLNGLLKQLAEEDKRYHSNRVEKLLTQIRRSSLFRKEAPSIYAYNHFPQIGRV